MKYLKYLLVLGLCFTSCEKEEQMELNNEQNLVLERPVLGQVNDSSFGHSFGNERNQLSTLEDHMQWTSFITAYAILDNNAARNNFMDVIETHGNTFNVGQLFISGDLSTNFESAFQASFELFFIATECKDCCPVTSGSNPGGIGAHGCVYAYDDFIDFILENNCLEIHLPSGMDLVLTESNPTTRQESVTTTAHPLIDNSSSNGGHKLFEAEISSEYVPVVNHNYGENNNVILVRPYRESPSCDYEEILVQDFTEFPCELNCDD